MTTPSISSAALLSSIPQNGTISSMGSGVTSIASPTSLPPPMMSNTSVPGTNIVSGMRPTDTLLSPLPSMLQNSSTCPVCVQSKKRPMNLVNTQFISKDRGIMQHQLLSTAYSR